MTTIDQVAEACRVSTATVSRVFNRRGTVKEPTRIRVMEAALTLGYNPRITARRDCLAIVVEDFRHLGEGGYHGALLTALTREISTRHYRMEILPAEELPTIGDKFYHGIISCLYQSDSLLKLTRLKTIPRININAKSRGSSSVCSDESQGMRIAVDHLFEWGHRRIALIAKQDATWSATGRREGFRKAITAHALSTTGCPLISMASDIPLLESAALALKHSPTALIVSGEENGPRISHALDLLGKRVTEDLSLITFQQSGISEFLRPAQTTLAQDFNALARQALTLLESHPTRSKNITVPYLLMPRASVSALQPI